MTVKDILTLIDDETVIQLVEPGGRVIADDLTEPIYSEAFANYCIDRIQVVEDQAIHAYIKVGPVIAQ